MFFVLPFLFSLLLLSDDFHLDLAFFLDLIVVKKNNDFFSDLFFDYFGDYLFNPFNFKINSSLFHVLEGVSKLL